MGSTQSIPTAPPSRVATDVPATCPMREGQAPTAENMNPLNRMPLTAQQSIAKGQQIVLPLERTLSTIPRAVSLNAGASACPIASTSNSTDQKRTAPVLANKDDLWEYPSPQQFYNALVRKNWETPEESIEMMVNIHNWMNEAAWQQVRLWEEKHNGGDRSTLASFEGRPQDLSPKARYNLMLAKIFPNSYHSLKPFDRHDWMVHRPVVSSPNSSSYTAPSSTQAYSIHRYVIDYYALPDDAEGNPVFSLDVRPALDSAPAVQERLTEWWKLKVEAWKGDGVGAGDGMGVRVQEEK